jgi:transposase
MLKQHKPAGQASRLTPEAWAGLLQAMRAGHIATMHEARHDLEREWAISYKNGKSRWGLFKKHRVTWKTGRRRHQQANPEQQACTGYLGHPLRKLAWCARLNRLPCRGM